MQAVHKKLVLAATTLALTCAAHAFDVDVRGEYRTGSEAWRSRIKIGNQWQNNFGASLEAGMFNGKGSLNEFRSDFNEIEAWYLYKTSPDLTVIPGGFLTWSSAGSAIKPYVRVNWGFAPTWRADVRARYDHNNYDVSTNWHMPADQAHYGRNDQWQFDFWLTKWIGDKTAVEYNYAWNRKDDNQFVYNNGRNWQYLNNLKVSYALQPNLIPYAEVGYLGKVASLANDDNEWRLRIGSVLRF